jgi:hypothetical protein
MFKLASPGTGGYTLNFGELLLGLAIAGVILVVVAIAAAAGWQNARYFNRHLIRRNRDLENELDGVKRRVEDLENLGVLPPGTLYSERDILVTKPGSSVWALVGVVAGFVVGYIVLRLTPPGPIYRAALLWTHGDRSWFQGLIWGGVGLVVMGLFMYIGSGTKRVRVMVRLAAPPTMMRATGSARGSVAS